MTEPAAEPAAHVFASFDGSEIAYQMLGEGPPVLMLHGFMADATLNWFLPGTAPAIAAAGFQVVAPDLRGHGRSAAPADPAAYPPDVLARDQEALIAHLHLTDWRLVGYSLGARTAVRMMARGAQPLRAALGGMGDDGVLASERRRAFFEDVIVHGARGAHPEAGRRVQDNIAQRGLNRDALLGVLGSFVATSREDLARIETPTLVACGERDDDNGSAEGLAALLPNSRAMRVRGDHLSAVMDPALTAAFIEHLRD